MPMRGIGPARWAVERSVGRLYSIASVFRSIGPASALAIWRLPTPLELALLPHSHPYQPSNRSGGYRAEPLRNMIDFESLGCLSRSIAGAEFRLEPERSESRLSSSSLSLIWGNHA